MIRVDPKVRKEKVVEPESNQSNKSRQKFQVQRHGVSDTGTTIFIIKLRTNTFYGQFFTLGKISYVWKTCRLSD